MEGLRRVRSVRMLDEYFLLFKFQSAADRPEELA